MNRGLLVFLALCAFAVAMVPRDRRAVNTEEEEEIPMSEGVKRICAPQTPCAWSVYKPNLKNKIDLNITNTYCSCGPGTVCTINEDDTTVSAFVYRCREPGDETENEKVEIDS